MASKRNGVTLDDGGLDKKLRQALQAAPQRASRTLTACILELAGQSSLRAPIESGDLRSNCVGKVGQTVVFEQQQGTGAAPPAAPRIEGSVGYSLPYALRQHEELGYSHDRTDGYRIVTGKNAGKTVNMVAGGEAKFLERPFQELTPRFIKAFEKVVKDVLK